MFKEALQYTLTFFIVLILWQLLFKSEISWFDNIGVSVTLFFVYLFVEWTKKPYKYKKH